MSQKLQPTPPNGEPDKRWFDNAVATINDAWGGTCTTATRPPNMPIGFHTFDVTIGSPIWVKSLNPTVWVNGAGTVV